MRQAFAAGYPGHWPWAGTNDAVGVEGGHFSHSDEPVLQPGVMSRLGVPNALSLGWYEPGLRLGVVRIFETAKTGKPTPAECLPSGVKPSHQFRLHPSSNW